MRIATVVRSLVLAAVLGTVPAASFAGVFVSISFGAPPLLPVYEQPVCPAAGYLWTPGYWAFDDDYGYYWVPGAWVLAPYPGALWTPGYWGWGDEGGYYWHAGYWGPRVGFYGGVNYGFGYFGHGYEGGYWDHDRFFYNRAVTRVNIVNVHNVYDRHVDYNRNDRIAFNGGRGGLQERPTPQEIAVIRDRHVAPIPAQQQNEMRAAQNRMQFARFNNGHPQNIVRTEPAAFDHNLPINRPAPMNGNVNRGPNTVQNPTLPTNRNLAGPASNMQRPTAPTMTNRQTYTPPVNQPQANRPGNQASPIYNRGPQPGYGAQNPQNTYRAQPQPGSAPTYNQPRPTMNQGYPQGYNQPRTQAPQSQMRPAPQPQERMQAPQSQMRPAPQPQEQRMQAPQSQMRPAPQPQEQRMQVPQMRTAPQPQMRPAPQPQQRMQAPQPQQHIQAPQRPGDGHGR